MTEDLAPMAEVEADFNEFWRPIVMPDGEWDLEQVKRELFDYHVVLTEVSKVYDHITWGRISKPNTAAFHVISAHDELCRNGAPEENEEA